MPLKDNVRITEYPFKLNNIGIIMSIVVDLGWFSVFM